MTRNSPFPKLISQLMKVLWKQVRTSTLISLPLKTGAKWLQKVKVNTMEEDARPITMMSMHLRNARLVQGQHTVLNTGAWYPEHSAPPYMTT